MGLPTSHSRIELMKQGLYSGFGWSLGVTLGFALVSTVVIVVLNNLGGLPIVGGFLADIVDATIVQLGVYSPETPVTPGR